jgi:flagellar hook-length control protein FliK
VEVHNLAAQLAESQKVENFSKDFFSLLGDLSTSFKDHLKQMVEQSEFRQQVQDDENLKSSIRENLSGKHQTSIQVKMSNEKPADEAQVPQKLKAKAKQDKTEAHPSDLINAQQALPIKKQAIKPRIKQVNHSKNTPIQKDAQALQKETAKPQADANQKVLKEATNQKISHPSTGQEKVADNAATLDLAKKADKSVSEAKAESKKPIHREIPPVKILKQDSEKLSKKLQDISNKTAVQLPNMQNLSQHVISSLRSNNSPLVKAIEAPQNNQAIASNTTDKGSVKKEALAQKSPPPKTDYSEQIDKMKNKVIKQVRMHLKLLLKEGGNEVQIKLKPAFLGNIKISINVEQESRVSQLTFQVQNESTKELIQNNLQQLKEAFEEKEIDLQNVNVETDDSRSDLYEQSANNKEDLEQSKKWISSFKTLNIETKDSDEPLASESEGDVEDPDQIINIVA